jgi:hypothetical protein
MLLETYQTTVIPVLNNSLYSIQSTLVVHQSCNVYQFRKDRLGQLQRAAGIRITLPTDNFYCTPPMPSLIEFHHTHFCYEIQECIQCFIHSVLGTKKVSSSPFFVLQKPPAGKQKGNEYSTIICLQVRGRYLRPCIQAHPLST